MAVKVIDTSALAAIVFGEPGSQKIAASIQADELVAPSLLPFELANVSLTKIRRYPAQREKLLAGFQIANRLQISYSPVDVMATLKIAEEKSLTVYDASYIWLAHALHAELLTLDKALAKAAR